MVVVIRYVFPYRSRWRAEDRNTRGRPRNLGGTKIGARHMTDDTVEAFERRFALLAQGILGDES
jgi:hypothetical protein